MQLKLPEIHTGDVENPRLVDGNNLFFHEGLDKVVIFAGAVASRPVQVIDSKAVATNGCVMVRYPGSKRPFPLENNQLRPPIGAREELLATIATCLDGLIGKQVFQ